MKPPKLKYDKITGPAAEEIKKFTFLTFTPQI